MARSEKVVPYIQIHTAVLLFGLTAILGELIHLPAVVLVWWRVLLTVFSLLFFIQFGKHLSQLPKALIWRYLGIGAIIGLHWICFYGSLKLSNVSICLVCLSTTTFFTSIFEPWFTNKKIEPMQVFTGMLIIPGMILIVNNIESGYYLGVGVGLLSALFAAIFSVLNKIYIQETDPYTMSFIELSGSWMLVSLALLLLTISGVELHTYLPVTWIEWLWLIILAFLCTTWAQVLTLKALRQLSAFAVNLTINLEPIYGIILAILLFKEHKSLTPMFYIGAAIILLSVFLYPILSKYKSSTLEQYE
ncbi:MAG: DMT family transporter [Chitinophagales bacterium]|nr:DMT family transporter [Chitinophagales bacterium]